MERSRRRQVAPPERPAWLQAALSFDALSRKLGLGRVEGRDQFRVLCAILNLSDEDAATVEAEWAALLDTWGDFPDKHLCETFRGLLPLLRRVGLGLVESASTPTWQELGLSGSDLAKLESAANAHSFVYKLAVGPDQELMAWWDDYRHITILSWATRALWEVLGGRVELARCPVEYRTGSREGEPCGKVYPRGEGVHGSRNACSRTCARRSQQQLTSDHESRLRKARRRVAPQR